MGSEGKRVLKFEKMSRRVKESRLILSSGCNSQHPKYSQYLSGPWESRLLLSPGYTPFLAMPTAYSGARLFCLLGDEAFRKISE